MFSVMVFGVSALQHLSVFAVVLPPPLFITNAIKNKNIIAITFLPFLLGLDFLEPFLFHATVFGRHFPVRCDGLWPARIGSVCDGLWPARIGVFVHTPTWIDPAGMESSLVDCLEIASGGNSDGESLADAWGGNSDGENLDADSDVGDVLIGLWGESPGDVDDSLISLWGEDPVGKADGDDCDDVAMSYSNEEENDSCMDAWLDDIENNGEEKGDGGDGPLSSEAVSVYAETPARVSRCSAMSDETPEKHSQPLTLAKINRRRAAVLPKLGYRMPKRSLRSRAEKWMLAGRMREAKSKHRDRNSYSFLETAAKALQGAVLRQKKVAVPVCLKKKSRNNLRS